MKPGVVGVDIITEAERSSPDLNFYVLLSVWMISYLTLWPFYYLFQTLIITMT